MTRFRVVTRKIKYRLSLRRLPQASQISGLRFSVVTIKIGGDGRNNVVLIRNSGNGLPFIKICLYGFPRTCLEAVVRHRAVWKRIPLSLEIVKRRKVDALHDHPSHRATDNIIAYASSLRIASSLLPPIKGYLP